jgi:aminopeptidase N
VKNIFKIISIIFFLSISVTANAQEYEIYKRPIQVERSRDFDVIHYRVTLSFDLDKKIFGGTNEVTLSPLKDDFKQCVFDAEDLVITQVVNSQNQTLKFEHQDHKLVMHFEKNYNYGQTVKFTIFYSGSDPGLGLFFVDESVSNPKMVITDSFPNRARRWFPCYDFPHDKVTAEMIITTKNENKVLSNGKLVSVTENKDAGTTTYHWSQEKPHSTYLSMIGIAPFKVIRDSLGSLPINYWVFSKDVEYAKWNLKKTPEMIEFFNELYGYDYPWAKYDQVTSPKMGGGAEATSATILGMGVIYDRRAEQDFSWDRIIAHEVAHQWFGDLLTLRTWSHTWLNESFATYSDYIWTNYDKGEDESAIDLLGKKNQYLYEAHTKYIRPIVFDRYNDPGDNFDSHTYPKGAICLHMLRFILGDENFFRVLNHYLHKHAFQPVLTEDLMIAVKDVTGQNMDWFFEQFIFKPGHMVFDISYYWNENSKKLQLTIKQVQDFSAGIPIYKIPVKIGIVTPKQKQSEKIWITKKEEVFGFTVEEKPLLVRFDEGNYLLKEWTFYKEIEELIYQLNNDDVIGRMWAAKELAKHKKETHVIDALADRVQNDDFWAVRESALVSWSNSGGEGDIDFLKTCCKDQNSKVRTTAIRLLGDTGDQKLISFYKDMFSKDDSYLVQAETLRSIGKCGDRSQLSYLEKWTDTDSPRNVIKKAVEWAILKLHK